MPEEAPGPVEALDQAEQHLEQAADDLAESQDDALADIWSEVRRAHTRLDGHDALLTDLPGQAEPAPPPVVAIVPTEPPAAPKQRARGGFVRGRR